MDYEKDHNNGKLSIISNDLININKNNAQFYKIYFVSCFHKKFIDNIINFYSLSENELELEFKKVVPNNPEYSYIIYSCKFNKNSKIQKKLGLGIIMKNDEKNYHFKEIIINPEKNKFIFDILKFKNEFDLIQILDNENKIPSLNSQNYYFLDLNIDIIFSFYFDYLEFLNNQNIDNKIFLKETSKYLINNYLTIINSKNNKKEFRDLASLIKFFVLCYNNEEILLFCDNFVNLKINIKIKQLVLIDNKFLEILKIYENEKNNFFIPLFCSLKNMENTKKKSMLIEKYSKILDNFINIYYIIYEKQKIIIDEKNVDEI